MACEDLKAKYDALEAQVAQLTALIASEPKPEQAAGQARLKALSGQAWAAGQKYAACVAAATPAAPGLLAPQSILTTNYANPAFNREFIGMCGSFSRSMPTSGGHIDSPAIICPCQTTHLDRQASCGQKTSRVVVFGVVLIKIRLSRTYEQLTG